MRYIVKTFFDLLRKILNFACPPGFNPLDHLGSIGFYFLWIVFISGVYLYIFFDTSVVGAYQSIESLTHEQWWLGGVMRSFHRYASDALVLVMLLHMLREYGLGRYHGPRWFSWVSGTPVLWFIIISGITGYWLIWDERAQYIAIVTAGWLDQLPVFGGVISRNFMTVSSLGDRFFTLLIFLHIVGPLFLLLFMWLHLQRISRARIHPPKAYWFVLSLMLLVVSLIYPAYSQAPANLGMVPGIIEIDWYYLAFYPMFDHETTGLVWWVGTALTLLLILIPWLPPAKVAPAVEVLLDNCNGCRRCVDDCPYGAVSMLPRSDGAQFSEEAVVKQELCTACGICVGSCPSTTPFKRIGSLESGINLPSHPIADLRAEILSVSKGLESPRIIVFACDNSGALTDKPDPYVGVVRVPCVGFVSPTFIDYALSRDKAEGIYLAGCASGNCYNRFGQDWTMERLARRRDPYLRKRVDVDRVATSWQSSDGQWSSMTLKAFITHLNSRPKGDEK